MVMSNGLCQRTESTVYVKILFYTQVLVHNIQSIVLPNNCQHTPNQEEWRLTYLKQFTFDQKALNAIQVSAFLLKPHLSLLYDIFQIGSLASFEAPFQMLIRGTFEAFQRKLHVANVHIALAAMNEACDAIGARNGPGNSLEEDLPAEEPEHVYCHGCCKLDRGRVVRVAGCL